MGKHQRKRSYRRRRAIGVAVGVSSLVAAFGLSSVPAGAVDNTGAFELDGNAVHTTADDWDNVCHQVTAGATCSTAPDTTGATAVSWTPELNLNATIFTGGGSKDPQDVSAWAWKDGAGGLPDKDNLLHSFAARYSITPNTDCTVPSTSSGTTCDVLYFGSDRYDNSGDAQQGFWFFQNSITQATTANGGGFGFRGVHRTGDILVISDFSNGGTTSTITVYKWDPTCTKAGGSCGDVNLRTLESSTNANCLTAATGDAFCGVVNTSNAAAPWPYTDKSGNNSYLPGEFYEGGINLSSLGLANECFSSVASETRSSTSTTATLKDFVLGSFANCSATMYTSVGAGPVTPGTTVNDTATVTGSSAANTPTGNVTFYLCQVATGPCSSGGTSLGSAALSGTGATATATSPSVNTTLNALAPGRYCFRAEWPGDSNYTTALSEYGGTNGDGGGISTHNECFTVAKLSTTTTTTPQDATPSAVTSVTLGSTVYDKAVVTGTAAGGDPTGSVNFYVCGPLTAPATCDGTTNVGTAVTGNPQTLVADTDASTYTASATSGGVTPSAVGLYCFRGVYGGNTVYNGSSDSASTECFTVTDSSGATSAQKWLPNDTATVTSTHGAPIAGTVTVVLYLSPDCTGDPVTGQSYTFNPDGTSTTSVSYDTTNTTYFVQASKTVSWLTTYTPTSSYVTGTTHCERTDLTITN